MIFQHFKLLSPQRIVDNVALPLSNLWGRRNTGSASGRLNCLILSALADKVNHYPAQISQRAEAEHRHCPRLPVSPAVLLSDEATSALDSETILSILELLARINRQMGLTIVLITHEMEVIRSVASRLVVLDRSRIVEEGPVKDIFARPQSETAKSLLQVIIPTLPPAVAAKFDPLFTAGCHPRAAYIRRGGAASLLSTILRLKPAWWARMGGIDTIQDEAVGRFFAMPANDKQKIDQACAWLARHSDKSEVLDYV